MLMCMCVSNLKRPDRICAHLQTMFFFFFKVYTHLCIVVDTKYICIRYKHINEDDGFSKSVIRVHMITLNCSLVKFQINLKTMVT